MQKEEDETASVFDPEMITISVKKYEEMRCRSAFLDSLEKFGVDSWDGYSVACEVK
jgi:hypothetical protein